MSFFKDKILIILLSLALLLGLASSQTALAAEEVFVVEISGTINPGLAAYVERAYEEAFAADADYVMMTIDTYGGRIDSAIKIKEIMIASPIPTVTYVEKKAISAGALLALAGNDLYMAEGTTMGAAEPRLGNELADNKTLSLWTKELSSTSELRGRDGDIAAAMADQRIVIPDLVTADELLTLSAQESLDNGMIEGIVENRVDIAKAMLWENEIYTEIEPNNAEIIAGWVTHPYVSPILLMLGISGIVLELFAAGFGLFGIMGLIAFALYFGGHIIAGFTGWWAVAIFILGIFLFIAEIFIVPGFGFAGIGGVVAIIASVVLSASSFEQAAASLGIAFLGSILLLVLSFRFVKTRKVWDKLILRHKEKTDSGYTAPKDDLKLLEGKTGEALTTLRPSGTAMVAGERVDVVTEGGYIEEGSKIVVLKVEGTRVIVGEIEE